MLHHLIQFCLDLHDTLTIHDPKVIVIVSYVFSAHCYYLINDILTPSFTAEVLWGHTTDSMCVGYMSSSLKKPKVDDEFSID